MVTLIFRSFLLTWAIIETSSSEYPRRSKTTVSPSLPPLQSRHASSTNNWSPSKPITLTTTDFNRFAVSTHPSSPRKPDSYNSYQLPIRTNHQLESKKRISSHNHGKIDNNYPSRLKNDNNYPSRLKNDNNYPSRLKNDNNYPSPSKNDNIYHSPSKNGNNYHSPSKNDNNYHSPSKNDNNYHSPSKIDNNYPSPSKIDNNYPSRSNPVTFPRNNERQSSIPTPIPLSLEKSADSRGFTTWPNIREDHLHDHADTASAVSRSTTLPGASLDRKKFHFESIPVMENNNNNNNNARPQSRIEFSDEDFDVIFNTQPHEPPKNVHIPIHKNIEHDQLLSDQPQLHFHMNPSQQTLYNSGSFGNMGRNQMFSDLPKRDGDRLGKGMMESFDPFQYSDFSETPASDIFKNYDRIFGKHSKIKPEAFRVQTHYPPRNEGEKQVEEVEEDVDEYRSEESSHEKYEKSREAGGEEKASEEARLERFEESYREETPYRGSKYAKEAERDSSERPEGRSDDEEEETRRSIEIDEKTRTTTKFPPFRYKSHHQRPTEGKSQRSNSQKHRKEQSHASRKIHS